MSKIEVNTIDTQCGSALQIGDGNTATIGLGKSGDTITIPSGATIVNSGTQTGFGRTGTVDWVTTPKVTGDSPVTAATGSGYFLNTTAGTITINLPAGAAGSIVSMADYAATWQTNNVTVAPNGSEKIGGTNNSVALSTEGQSVTFVYVDSTQGWVNTMDSTSNVRAESFMTATGGTPCAGATCGDYKIHTFTGPGTFEVTAISSSAPNNAMDYLVVGGGGGGACCAGGGGGGGGVRAAATTFTNSGPSSPRTPISGPTAVSAITATVASFPITVGAGGAKGTPAPANGSNGSVSTAFPISSAGGGGGADRGSPVAAGDGGSGGGAAAESAGPSTGGNGNTPSVSPAQGSNGGDSSPSPVQFFGGGGGFMAVGQTGCAPNAKGGNGGAGGGFPNAFGTSGQNCGSVYYFGGGGGGGKNGPGTPTGTGGLGGGGNGQLNNCVANPPNAGTVNTGGAGGGGGAVGTNGGGGAGGSGIVIIRYKFQ